MGNNRKAEVLIWSEGAQNCRKMLPNDPCYFQHHCDPLIRNIREESPLELAAQYGRLETVQLLLRKHPSLLGDTVDKHSALHLASRNGHKAVVQVLIDAGFNINTKVTFQLLCQRATMWTAFILSYNLVMQSVLHLLCTFSFSEDHDYCIRFTLQLCTFHCRQALKARLH